MKDFEEIYGKCSWITRWLLLNSFIRYIWVKAAIVITWELLSEKFTKTDFLVATMIALMVSFFTEIMIRDMLATKIMFRQAEISDLKSQIKYMKRQSGE
ncbi:MAG: hypothetical protein Q4A21_01900 [bacterium]|nr:hypothetical protein [bacterium]